MAVAGTSKAPPFEDVVYNPDRGFPAWHYRMLNDRARNRAIEAAIAAADVGGRTVFEIGAGAGLIALLFAKHGAAKVTSCEINPSLAAIARRVVERAGYANRIEIIEGAAADVVRRNLLPAPPDIIFTETVDSGVIGEGLFAIAADIKALAGPATRVMPQRIDQFGVLVEAQAFHDLNFVDEVCGFDLSHLNTYSTPGYLPVAAALHPHRVLSKPVLLRSYDYRAANRAEPRRIEVIRPGTAHGLLTWFALHFGTETVTSAPEADSHWRQAFHPLKGTPAVEAGQGVWAALDDAGVAELERGARSKVR